MTCLDKTSAYELFLYPKKMSLRPLTVQWTKPRGLLLLLLLSKTDHSLGQFLKDTQTHWKLSKSQNVDCVMLSVKCRPTVEHMLKMVSCHCFLLSH